jgi:hypothetical protein
MDKGTTPAKSGKAEKRPGRSKVTPRVEVEEKVIKAEIPPGSRFKGYESFLVQDLVISARASRYQRERWVTPDGRTILAPLPEGIEGHFGPELRRFVLMQYHQGQSTLPRLLTLLRSVGISISKRQLVRLLNEDHEGFVVEAREVLRAGLATSSWVTVDDTSAAPCREESILYADRQRVVHLVPHAVLEEPSELPRSAPRRTYRLRAQ